MQNNEKYHILDQNKYTPLQAQAVRNIMQELANLPTNMATGTLNVCLDIVKSMATAPLMENPNASLMLEYLLLEWGGQPQNPEE